MAKEPKWLKAARERDAAKSPTPKEDFISRALSRAGVLPEAEARQAVEAGRVTVDGVTVRSPFAPVGKTTRIVLDGKRIELSPTTRVIVFHKPAGTVVSGHDDHGGRTVFEVFKAALPMELQSYGWLAVGRLDRDTTGVLFFTNDEQFVAFATNPETHLPKRYVVTVGGDVTEPKLAKLRRGVSWDEVTSRPAQARERSKGIVELVLTEGKFHQVKRMMNAVGLATLQLHREAVADYVLDVAEGQWRELSGEEIRSSLHYTPRQDALSASE